MTSCDVKRPVVIESGIICVFEKFRMEEHLPTRWKILERDSSRGGEASHESLATLIDSLIRAKILTIGENDQVAYLETT